MAIEKHKVDYGDGAGYEIDGENASFKAYARGSGVGAASKASYSLFGDTEELTWQASDKVSFKIDGINEAMFSAAGFVQLALLGPLNLICMQSPTGNVKVCVRTTPVQVILQIGDLRIVIAQTPPSISILLGDFGVQIIPGPAIMFNVSGACLDVNKVVAWILTLLDFIGVLGAIPDGLKIEALFCDDFVPPPPT